jgi:hypothetical protein
MIRLGNNTVKYAEKRIMLRLEATCASDASA